MSSPLPYLMALLVGLLLAAVLSGVMVRRLQLRATQRAQALRLLAALGRYAVWPAALRAPLGEGLAEDLPEAPSPALLAEVQALQARSFPQAGPQMARLCEADAALREFLQAQQALKLRDTEDWLESDHELRLDGLCERLQAAIQALTHAVRDTPVPTHGITAE